MGLMKTKPDGSKKFDWLGLAVEVVKAVVFFLSGTQI